MLVLTAEQVTQLESFNGTADLFYAPVFSNNKYLLGEHVLTMETNVDCLALLNSLPKQQVTIQDSGD